MKRDNFAKAIKAAVLAMVARLVAVVATLSICCAALADRWSILPDGSGIIESVEREQGIRYAPMQRKTLEIAAANRVMVLTGGPGTGNAAELLAGYGTGRGGAGETVFT